MRWAETTFRLCMSTPMILTVAIIVRCNHMALLRLRSWVLCHPGWILVPTEHQNYQRDVSYHSTCTVIVFLSSNYTTLCRRSVFMISSIKSQLSSLSFLDFYLLHFYEQASGRVVHNLARTASAPDTVTPGSDST